jgi:hypothetical protein
MEKLIDPLTEHAAVLSNAEIADRLASLGQLLTAQKENPYKVKAYGHCSVRTAKAKVSAGTGIIQVWEEVDASPGR